MEYFKDKFGEEWIVVLSFYIFLLFDLDCILLGVVKWSVVCLGVVEIL